MPHLTMDYSSNLGTLDVPHILGALNSAIAASGQVADPLDLKGRANRHEVYQIGTPDVDPAAHGFVHVSLALLAGRAPDAKKAISARLMSVLQEQAYPAALRVQFSVEIRDMERETYSKAFRAAQD